MGSTSLTEGKGLFREANRPGAAKYTYFKQLRLLVIPREIFISTDGFVFLTNSIDRSLKATQGLPSRSSHWGFILLWRVY